VIEDAFDVRAVALPLKEIEPSLVPTYPVSSKKTALTLEDAVAPDRAAPSTAMHAMRLSSRGRLPSMLT